MTKKRDNCINVVLTVIVCHIQAFANQIAFVIRRSLSGLPIGEYTHSFQTIYAYMINMISPVLFLSVAAIIAGTVVAGVILVILILAIACVVIRYVESTLWSYRGFMKKVIY